MTEAPAAMPDVYPNVATNHSRNVACFPEDLRGPDGSRDAAGALRSLTVVREARPTPSYAVSYDGYSWHRHRQPE